MATNKKIAEFPDVEAKLQKTPKQSAFKRQRAEAEAKRKREAEETAAVYEDFVKSFDHDGKDDHNSSFRNVKSRLGGGDLDRPSFGSLMSSGGPGKRHFGVPSGSLMKSGPGSLGPITPSLGRKRTREVLEGSSAHEWDRDVEDNRGRLGFEDRDAGPLSVSKAFDASDDEHETNSADRAEEKATSKPTLRLANLPTSTSPAAIKALIPSILTVENVKIVPPSGPSEGERKYITAIVTLSRETPATDIDAAVSALQNRYLGFGYYLSLHRHLSSAAISSSLSTITSGTTSSRPFGAIRVIEGALRRGAQNMGHGRGYAPPSSYGGTVIRGGLLHVPVQPPRDIKKLRMIHKVLESVLEHGSEFEALLMSRPEVQREEKWAWIWDARSEGGIWYRWRLWDIITGFKSKRDQAKYVPLFEGSHAWKVPEKSLPYEYTTGVDEFVSGSEYNSSEDDDYYEEPSRHVEASGAINDQEDTFLNPIEKSKLAYLLARLPTTLSRLRKGDVARITAFSITHASRGADEIVAMIVSNIDKPFAYTTANPELRAGAKTGDQDSREASLCAEEKDKGSGDASEKSAASLLGLYVVSDILSSSSTSGIRHAWRYRQLFESALRSHKTFEKLGAMADKHGWGRLRAEKWKRSVGLVLSLWEGWCVFALETHEFLVKSFENSPLARKEVKSEETAKKLGSTSKWKTVEAGAAEKEMNAGRISELRPVMGDAKEARSDAAGVVDEQMVIGSDEEDLDPETVIIYSEEEASALDGDIDGETLVDFDDLQITDKDATGIYSTREDKMSGGFSASAGKAAGSKKRMRAVDLFADSASDEDQ